MARRNAPKRRRNPLPPISLAIPSNPKETCQQCSLAHRRVHFSISLPEAESIVTALKSFGNKPAIKLATYFDAHVTIAKRQDSDEYD